MQKTPMPSAAGGRLMENLLEERNAPAATGAGPAAFGELARHLGARLTDEIHQLPPADVEAVTDLSVEIHEPGSERMGPSSWYPEES